MNWIGVPREIEELMEIKTEKTADGPARETQSMTVPMWRLDRRIENSILLFKAASFSTHTGSKTRRVIPPSRGQLDR